VVTLFVDNNSEILLMMMNPVFHEAKLGFPVVQGGDIVCGQQFRNLTDDDEPSVS
jgi:hypothetical protein